MSDGGEARQERGKDVGRLPTDALLAEGIGWGQAVVPQVHLGVTRLNSFGKGGNAKYYLS